MSIFLDAFPRIVYDPVRSQYSNYDTVTNILFRVGFLKSVLNNTSLYTEYTISDSDTPEILAEKVYNDPNAYWMILYANDIYDPQYDWPLNYRSFLNYMANKYRSQAAADLSIPVNTITNQQVINWTKKENDPAANNIHHYEKVIERTETFSGVTSTFINEIDYAPKANASIFSAESYDSYIELAESGSYETFNIGDRTVDQRIYARFVTIFDYENDLNDRKRQIKLINPTYYSQIMNEFNGLTNNAANPNLRRLV